MRIRAYYYMQQNEVEYAGYVYQMGEYYYYSVGRDVIHSYSSNSVYLDVDIPSGAELSAIFHTHTVSKDDAYLVFSEQDYQIMKRRDVDSYVVDTNGSVFCPSPDAANRTEAVQVLGINIRWED